MAEETQIPSTLEPPEPPGTQEDTPMLDVHPAHHAASTWRDFFVHIATIVLGLLIAVGIEQTVEYFHHRHQLIQFEEDIRAEAELNLRIIDSTLAVNVPAHGWLAAIVKAAQQAPTANGLVTLAVPAKVVPALYQFDNSNYGAVPSHGVWAVAKSTGIVELIPKERAQIYERLDWEATECIRINGISDLESQNMRATLRGLGVNLQPGANIRLTSAQRDRLVDAISKSLAIAHWDDVRYAIWKGASDALIHDVPTMRDMFPYISRAADQVPEP